jgi:hypothetical protein
MMFSSSSCGSKMALKPSIVPRVNETVTSTIPPATYYYIKCYYIIKIIVRFWIICFREVCAIQPVLQINSFYFLQMSNKI